MPLQLPSTSWSLAANLLITAYALGCFTTGYYLVRWRTGKDVRDSGSGNVGAKNVGRILGKAGFFMTVLGDVGKGIIAISIARCFAKDDFLVCLAVLAVTAGHVWPVQLHFRGGKGVATSLGALLIYDYHLIVFFLMLFAAGFACLRKTMLPALFAFTCLPLACLYLHHDANKILGISLLAFVVVTSHWKNLLQEGLHLGRKAEQNAKD